MDLVRRCPGGVLRPAEGERHRPRHTTQGDVDEDASEHLAPENAPFVATSRAGSTDSFGTGRAVPQEGAASAGATAGPISIRATGFPIGEEAMEEKGAGQGAVDPSCQASARVRSGERVRENTVPRGGEAVQPLPEGAQASRRRRARPGEGPPLSDAPGDTEHRGEIPHGPLDEARRGNSGGRQGPPGTPALDLHREAGVLREALHRAERDKLELTRSLTQNSSKVGAQEPVRSRGLACLPGRRGYGRGHATELELILGAWPSATLVRWLNSRSRGSSSSLRFRR